MATRSPSPNPIRPTSHNPKTPERNSSLRKSKESTQRSSVLKAPSTSPSLRASFDHMENAKSRSPAISSSKGSKSFMAPTISAASKVNAAASFPRKKILQERNEVTTPTPVSISLEFPMLMKEIGPKSSEMGFDSQQVLGGNEVTTPVVSRSLEFQMKEGVLFKETGPKSEMDFGSREVSGGNELRKRETVVVPLPLAPLDVDPSLPPYDPRTNYLSPRPRFLHYRPNPRIEHYLGKEGDFLDGEDGRRLEDTFSSESSEDDVTVVTEEKEKDSEEEEFQLEETVTVLTEEKDSKEEEGEEIAFEDGKKQFSEEINVTEVDIQSKPYKLQLLKRFKLVPLLFVLVIACLYAPLSDSPIISSSMLKVQSVSKLQTPSFAVFEDLHLRDYFAVANENLRGLARRFRHWSTDLIAYFTFVASPLKDEIGYHPTNLTSSAVDESSDLVFSYKHEIEVPEAMKEIGVEELSFTGQESEVSEVVEEYVAEFEAEKIEEAIDEKIEIESTTKETEEIDTVVSEVVKESDFGVHSAEMDISEEGHGMETETIEEDLRQEMFHPSNEIINDEEVEIHSQSLMGKSDFMGVRAVCSDATFVDPTETISLDDYKLESDKAYPIPRGFELLKSMNQRTILGLLLALLFPAATVAMLYIKQKRTPLATNEKHAAKKVGSMSVSSETYTPAKGSHHRNHNEDERIIGDSGLSEVSSSQNNTPSNGQHQMKRGKEEDHDLSNERRRPRRDSTAASSCSISYGSFTTYEKLSARKGGRDEEVATPVRRSSRIRNLVVTSP